MISFSKILAGGKVSYHEELVFFASYWKQAELDMRTSVVLGEFHNVYSAPKKARDPVSALQTVVWQYLKFVTTLGSYFGR
jgi:hypothetical protein